MIIVWQCNPASVLCLANRIKNTELRLGFLNGQAHRSCRIAKLLNRTPTCFNLLCLACLSTFLFVFAVLVTLFNLPDNMLALLSGTSRPHHSLTFSVSLSLTLTRVSTLIKAHLFFIPAGWHCLLYFLSELEPLSIRCWVTPVAQFPTFSFPVF